MLRLILNLGLETGDHSISARISVDVDISVSLWVGLTSEQSAGKGSVEIKVSVEFLQSQSYLGLRNY